MPEILTEAQVRKLLELSEKATPGWRTGQGQLDYCIVTDAVGENVFTDDYNRGLFGSSLVAESIFPANRDFAIAARNLLPALAQSWLDMAGEAEGLRRTETTNIKFITEVIYEVQDEDISPDERLSSYQVYECCKCHWRYSGEAHRFGYGYTCQGVDTPNYCPMCGTKIEDIEEDVTKEAPHER